MAIVVMTGATSGFGVVTADRLRATPGTRLIMGARSGGRAQSDTLPLDLASLQNARAFAYGVAGRLGDQKIDALVLNAGAQFANADGRTVDGYETTFAVNHLAHYLLLRLLAPQLADHATVVLTTSGTHDPAERTIVPAPRHANAEYLAHPDRDPERDKNRLVAAGRAYSSSKLCDVLTARAFAAQPDTKARGLTVVAYDPGATPGTRLVRNGPLLYRGAWQLPRFLLAFIIPQTSSIADAGRALADLATGTERPPPGRIYAALRGGKLNWKDPSELARDDDAMEALWRDSAALCAI